MEGNMHYGTLLRSVEGINPRILAHRLREFEQEGILLRKVLPTNPPQVEYTITEKGLALSKVVTAMKKWYQIYG
jgi:DNA-binding HxlR family transcriptional regulator